MHTYNKSSYVQKITNLASEPPKLCSGYWGLKRQVKPQSIVFGKLNKVCSKKSRLCVKMQLVSMIC